MMIEKDLLRELASESAGDQMDGWLVLSNEVDGTWRWGTEHTLVLQKIGSEEIYGHHYRLSGGDGDYNSFEEEDDQVQLLPMRAVQAISYELMK